MLVEFRVANFRSFREEQVLSLVASRDNSLPDSCIATDKFRLLRAAAIYGPNASGKSNLIKAISFMQDTVVRSVEQSPSSPSRLSPFRLDPASLDEPSLFEVTIILDGVQYQYGFTMSRERIHEEWLFAFPEGVPQKWFQRGLDPETQETTWKWSSYFKGEKARLSGLTRPDALFLTVGAKFNHKQLHAVHQWFDNSLRVVLASNMLGPVTETLLLRAEEVSPEDASAEEATAMREYLTEFLRDADLGIEDVSVLRQRIQDSDFFKNLPASLKSNFPEDMVDGNFTFKVETVHRDARGMDVRFDLGDESDGTQRMFQFAGPWLEALLNGYTVLIDEIGASLHSLLVRELVKSFLQIHESDRGAQLVFTTHDTTLLAPELLRRDQVWFTEKNEMGATTLRPLSDYKKARKGEAMQKGYLSGRYGAIPILKAFGV